MTRNSLTLAVLAVTVVLAAEHAAADFRIERQLQLTPGGTFVLNTSHGAVDVTSGSSANTVVRITSSDDDFEDHYTIDVEERSGYARMTVRRRGGWLGELLGGGFFHGHNTRFAVQVPRGARIEISTSGGSIAAAQVADARLRTSGGSIKAVSLEGNLDAGTSGGGIAVDGVRGNVRAETSGGGIQIDNVSGDVFAGTSGGGIRVRRAAGRVEAHSSGGPVAVSFTPGNGRGGELTTSGGGVTAEIDPRVALSIDAATSGGDVTSDLPVTMRGTMSRRAIRGDLNGGGPLLRMRTSGGGVRLAATR